MPHKSDEMRPEENISRESDAQSAHARVRLKQPRYLLVAWILLLLIGALFLFASISDLASDARIGLPSDHLDAFHTITGYTWTDVQRMPHLLPGKMTQYITLLEVAYAFHEMVFALLFLVIVAIPFRRRARWAWWACWVPMLANIAYTFTFGRYSTTTLAYSLVVDIALPVLLLVHIPAFFDRGKR